MKKYGFYTKQDKKQELITTVGAPSRYHAAIFFAKQKQLTLKEFLKIYGISR